MSTVYMCTYIKLGECRALKASVSSYICVCKLNKDYDVGVTFTKLLMLNSFKL